MKIGVHGRESQHTMLISICLYYTIYNKKLCSIFINRPKNYKILYIFIKFYKKNDIG